MVSIDTSRAYCTYFDGRYLSRGLAMIESLRAVGDSSTVVVLALDQAAAAGVRERGGPHVQVIVLADIEAAFPQLLTVRDQRSTMEYLFTMTPWLTRYTMDRVPDAEWATYLDADLWFFSSVDPIYAELASGSVGIVPHRFTPEQAWREQYGHYNVGWVSFRSDLDGRACLDWWADSCLDWCYDRPEDGRFADQGYLNDFSQVVDSVVVIANPGVDTAPWNLAGHVISVDAGHAPLVDGQPLICYHFHGLSRHGDRFRFKHLTYHARTTPVIRDAIYRPYVTRLAQLDGPGYATGSDRQHAGLNAFGRMRARVLTWLGDRRGDFVDL